MCLVTDDPPRYVVRAYRTRDLPYLKALGGPSSALNPLPATAYLGMYFTVLRTQMFLLQSILVHKVYLWY
jgi:hypothetical protein